MLSRGVYPVKLSNLDQLRVWAALTGLLLAAAYFAMVWLGLESRDSLVMLTVSVAGFELFFLTQELSQAWRRRNG